MEVVFDTDRHMYLRRGWEQFVRAYDMRHGYFLVLRYDGNAMLTVKVFNMVVWQREQKYDVQVRLTSFIVCLVVGMPC